MTQSGELAARRRDQQVKWLHDMLEERMFARLRSDTSLRGKLKQAEAAVADGRLAATLAVEQLAAALGL
jgi:LAO/AO transport system kinase